MCSTEKTTTYRDNRGYNAWSEECSDRYSCDSCRNVFTTPSEVSYKRCPYCGTKFSGKRETRHPYTPRWKYDLMQNGYEVCVVRDALLPTGTKIECHLWVEVFLNTGQSFTQGTRMVGYREPFETGRDLKSFMEEIRKCKKYYANFCSGVERVKVWFEFVNVIDTSTQLKTVVRKTTTNV